MKSVEVKHGNHPVVLAIPHTGSYIPEEILKAVTQPAKQLIDTDWNVHCLHDCHSIRSRISNLFPSYPPVFNIGTYDGTTCSPAIENNVRDICEQSDAFTTVVNDRFKESWTTRNYGQPSTGIHAIQMELGQSTYMLESSPWIYNDKKAQMLTRVLARILKALVA